MLTTAMHLPLFVGALFLFYGGEYAQCSVRYTKYLRDVAHSYNIQPEDASNFELPGRVSSSLSDLQRRQVISLMKISGIIFILCSCFIFTRKAVLKTIKVKGNESAAVQNEIYLPQNWKCVDNTRAAIESGKPLNLGSMVRDVDISSLKNISDHTIKLENTIAIHPETKIDQIKPISLQDRIELHQKKGFNIVDTSEAFRVQKKESEQGEFRCCGCMSTSDHMVAFPCGHTFDRECALNYYTIKGGCAKCGTQYQITQLKDVRAGVKEKVEGKSDN